MREESIPLDEDAAAEGISTGKDTSSTSISIEEEPPNVLIVGAGLAGCATALAMHHAGFRVRVFERLSAFHRLGDSLGLGENALKLLKRWGLHDQLVRIGNQAPEMQIRRWRDGEVLARQPLMDMAGYIGHRGDYHREFLRRVEEVGVKVEMGRKVVGYFEEDVQKEGHERGNVGVKFENGEMLRGDVVVACDGIKSLARKVVLGFEDRPRGSGYACFRAYFRGEELDGEEMCKEFTGKDCVNIWIGEDVHLVQNTLRGGEEFNWILTHRDTEDIKESWFQPGDMNVVRSIVKDCDPKIAAAVRRTKQCLDWKICYRDPIPTWVSKGHRIALLGDCCHPHLPTSAQGASQATESAAVLALCLKLAGKESVPLATRVYEKLRFTRTRQSQRNGEDIRDRWHNILKNLDHGMEIDPEDVKMRNRWLYPFDAEADTMERWPEISAKVEKELRAGELTALFTSDEEKFPPMPPGALR